MYPIAVFGASEGMTCKAEDILLYSNASPQVLCPESTSSAVNARFALRQKLSKF
jgi:hypothetical protein